MQIFAALKRRTEQLERLANRGSTLGEKWTVWRESRLSEEGNPVKKEQFFTSICLSTTKTQDLPIQ